MMLGLSDLTVCIFTHNQKKDLERLTKFWVSTDAKIIILDSSDQPAHIIGSKNLSYFHVPNMPIQKRILKFSKISNSKYILLSPDDDFFSHKGLSEVIKFLDSNLDFASAQGLRVRFFDFPNFHWIPDYLKQMRLKFIEEDNLERLNKMAGSMHYIYSVIRATEFSKIVNCFHNVNTEKKEALSVGELIFNYTLPILGKHTILPVFYSARKAHPFRGRNAVFGNWINDESDIDRNIFKKNICNFYMNELGCTESEAIMIFSKLSKDFTIVKLNGIKKEYRYKELLRKIVFNSNLSKFHWILKLKFFKFYILLIKNHNFLKFTSDLRVIKKFLNNNRIEK